MPFKDIEVPIRWRSLPDLLIHGFTSMTLNSAWPSVEASVGSVAHDVARHIAVVEFSVGVVVGMGESHCSSQTSIAVLLGRCCGTGSRADLRLAAGK